MVCPTVMKPVTGSIVGFSMKIITRALGVSANPCAWIIVARYSPSLTMYGEMAEAVGVAVTVGVGVMVGVSVGGKVLVGVNVMVGVGVFVANHEKPPPFKDT